MKCVCLLPYSFAHHCNLKVFFSFFSFFRIWTDSEIKRFSDSLAFMCFSIHSKVLPIALNVRVTQQLDTVKHRKHWSSSQAPQATQKQSSTIAGRGDGGRAGWDWDKGRGRQTLQRATPWGTLASWLTWATISEMFGTSSAAVESMI